MGSAMSDERKDSIDELVGCGLERRRAEVLAAALEEGQKRSDTLDAWRSLSKEVLSPTDPHPVHTLAHRRTFAAWDDALGPRPTWVPAAEEIAKSNLGRVMHGDYAAFHRRSVERADQYWSEMLDRLGIVSETPPDKIVDMSRGAEQARWLLGMQLNIAASVFTRDPMQPAVVWQAEGGELVRVTLGELQRDAEKVACSLSAAGFEVGDAIAIDMPMTYESVVLYLGIVMYGAVVVSIADSFAAEEIDTRLRIAEAKGIITQDVIVRGSKTLPLYTRVRAALDSMEASMGARPRAIVLAAGERLSVELADSDQSYVDFLAAGEGVERGATFVIGDVEAPTNILFSSGTTGDPKAIAWTHATPIKAAADGWGHHDIQRGDVVAWPTNLGWMMGPWLIYASLLNNAAMALYQGSPLGRDFGQFVQDAGVTMLGVVPSLVKAWKSSDCMAGLDWSEIRCFSSTGEASNADEMHWLMARAGYKPVIEYCGGTEIGGGYITGTVVQPQAPATFSTAALGCDFVIFDEEGKAADNGELALKTPMFGSSNRLLNRDHHEVYFAGMPSVADGSVLRRHGDQMEALGSGYHRAHGRVDDTMNLGGIKTSSAEIERACNTIAGVHETAAIAVSPPGGGPSQLVVYVVLDAGSLDAGSLDADGLRGSFQSSIRSHLNPLFKVTDVVIVDALPRTASNKVMRRVLRAQYQQR
jgi:acetyl-CoA synthetase